MMLYSLTSEGLVAGTRKFSSERHWLNLLMLMSSSSFIQLQLRIPLIVAGDMRGMLTSVLMKCSS